MRTIILSILIGFEFNNANAQNWIISRSIGGPSAYPEWGQCIKTDAVGNIYVAGCYEDSAYFDTIVAHSVTYYTGAYFLAKYNSSGGLIWLKTGGGGCGTSASPKWNSISSIALDANLNCYITGTFCGNSNFDTIHLSSTGDMDIFVAKFNSSGSCLWAKACGGGLRDGGNGICLDKNNNIYLTGFISSPAATFDTITYSGSSVRNKLFVAKFSNDGNCIWLQTSGGSQSANADSYDVTCFNDRVYLTGSADSGIVIDNTVINASCGLFVNLDTSGNFIWIKSILGGAALKLGTDNSGNIYMTGSYHDGTVFDTIRTHQNNGSWDTFIAKYNDAGEVYWVSTLNSSIIALSNGITTNKLGESCITGFFSGTADFGSTQITSSGTQDIYLAKYNTNGACIGAIKAGDTIAEGKGITTDSTGSIYVTGQYRDSIFFGSNHFQCLGPFDIFWAKLDQLTTVFENGRKESYDLIIYSNPSQGKFKISVPGEFKNVKKLILSIYDSNALLIQQAIVQMEGDEINADIQTQAKGIYNVTLSNGKKIYAGKLVFE